MRFHPVDRRFELFVITHIRPKAKRDAAGVLDFKVRKIEFGFAPGEERNPRAVAGKSDR